MNPDNHRLQNINNKPQNTRTIRKEYNQILFVPTLLGGNANLLTLSALSVGMSVK